MTSKIVIQIGRNFLIMHALVIGGSGSGKANELLNPINNEPNIDNFYIYLYAKDLHKVKHQLLTSKRKSTGLKNFIDSRAFIEYADDMDEIYKNIEKYNPKKKRKILIVFNSIIADMLSNENLDPIVTKLSIRGRKSNIYLVFVTQSYFAVPKNFRLNSAHYFVMKIPNKKELQQIAFNHSSDIDFQEFMNFYKKCTAKPYFFCY